MSCASRSTEVSASRVAAGQSVRSGWASETSRLVRSAAIGLRSSCEASATKRCCWAAERSSRSSVALVVRAIRAISSPERGTGTRRSSRCSPISASSARIASTGRSARLVAVQAISATSSAAAGTPACSTGSMVRSEASAANGVASTYTVNGPTSGFTWKPSLRSSGLQLPIAVKARPE